MKYKLRIASVSKRAIAMPTLIRLGVAASLFVTLVAGFAFIAKQVIDGDTLTKDSQVLLWINDYAHPILDSVIVGVTLTGNIGTVLIMSTCAIFFLKKYGEIRSIIQIIFTVGGAIMLNILLKYLFQRDRPKLWQLVIQESTYSFPSGHALITAAFATSLVFIWWKVRYRWLIVVAAALYVLLVGFSRLYLGVHYPTDVIAGWCVGVAWAVIVAIVLKVVVIEKRSNQHGK